MFSGRDSSAHGQWKAQGHRRRCGGDRVVATDPKTGRTEAKKVTRLIRTESDKDFNELTVETPGGNKKLTATHEHPFWSISESRWVAAGQLKPGMTLRSNDGSSLLVKANRSFVKHARTYNLTVEGLHTYYVLAGETPVLVHNAGSDPTTPKIILRGVQQIKDGTLQQRTNPGHTPQNPNLDYFTNKEKSKKNNWWIGAKIYAPDPNNNDYRILEKNGQFKWVGPKGNVKGAGHFYGKLMDIPGC
ncbi:polymorphic toxin-type HINT domain-containing protein [Streptomyces sp. NPDC015184]|uniref:polymorphic toxin-type HINT domain-containing protein n=1 Tax=Streptomyces sp. NPDC015184 TaxID=3364946 RepID=UPI0036F7A7C0